MIANGVLRALQILFGIVILGLSITLIREQLVVSAPSQTTYAAFSGAFTILAALVGLAALFISAIEARISSGFDSLAAVLSLAGGIALALAIKGSGNCNNVDFNSINRIISGAWYTGDLDNGVYYDGPGPNPLVSLPSRCHEAQAITTFMFMAGVALGVTMVLGIMGRKKSVVGSY